VVSAGRAGRAVPFPLALRALCQRALAAGGLLRALLARGGGLVRVDKAAQEEALRSCLVSAAARRARDGGRRERLEREPGFAETVRRPGPDRLPCLLGFVPDGWGRDLTLEDAIGVAPRPAAAGIARRHDVDLGEREIGGW
jgi:hypothetical protein